VDDGDYGTRDSQLQGSDNLHNESDDDVNDQSSMKSGQFKALNSSLKVQ